MKSVNLPLFWKFAITMFVLVFIFGMINMFILWKSVYRSFENEIDKRSVVLSTIISEKAVDPIVYEDVVSLYNILNDMVRSDSSIAYIFITDQKGKVVAKTFDTDVPPSLLTANEIHDGKYNIELLDAKNYKFHTIRDIAFPILGGHIGTVRMGLIEDSIRTEIKSATNSLLTMILLFLVIGLIGAFGFSYLITSPIHYISNQAQRVNFDTLNLDIKETKYPRYKRLLNFYFSDELDLLVAKFKEMLFRLKHNYTELQKTRNSFVQAEKMAAIGTLAAGIGHEINNPISGIKNCLIRISKQPDNLEQTANYIRLIQDATDKIENVTQHLLDFSRKQESVFTIIDVSETLNNSISLISYKAEKAHIKLMHNFSNRINVVGSQNHLEQVFLNMLLNSIDAINEVKERNPEYQGVIKILLEKNHGKVLINIEDNGVGISNENQRKIFDPFYTSKEAGKGTGLGLYVSFNIIKEHNGEIYFKSEPGKGTVFSIELKETKNQRL